MVTEVFTGRLVCHFAKIDRPHTRSQHQGSSSVHLVARFLSSKQIRGTVDHTDPLDLCGGR